MHSLAGHRGMDSSPKSGPMTEILAYGNDLEGMSNSAVASKPSYRRLWEYGLVGLCCLVLVVG